MKRFTWWRMEQNAPHNARERWCASCSILHHVKRFMSQPPETFEFLKSETWRMEISGTKSQVHQDSGRVLRVSPACCSVTSTCAYVQKCDTYVH